MEIMPAMDIKVTDSFTYEATGIKSIRIDSQNAFIYDMRGNRIDQLQRGVNIIRMNDGRTRKVVVGSKR